MDNFLKAKSLENSVKINLELKNNSFNVYEPFYNEMIKTLNKKRFHKKKYQIAFNVILSNLIYWQIIDSKKYITCGFSKNFFYQNNNQFKIKGDVFFTIINWLIEKKYIIYYKGFQKDKYSRYSRIKISIALLNRIKKKYKEIIKGINIYTKDVIIIKNKEKKIITLKKKKSKNFIKKEKILLDYNHLLNNTIITLKDKILPRQFLYRVFNESSLKKGGRFYGSFYQVLSKSERKNLHINGQQIVELDFSSVHISILYNKINLFLNKDAYNIPHFNKKKYRKLVKLATIIMLNSSSYLKSKKSIQYLMNKRVIPECDIDFLMESILDYHKPIVSFFFKEYGLHLQYLESRIAELIIKTFIYRKNPIPLLCIHDGFICQKKYKKILEKTMIQSYYRITKSKKINIHIV